MNIQTILNTSRNRNEEKIQKIPSSIPEYLHNLGIRLLWHFPMAQVLDILDDYQEYLATEKEQGTENDRLLQKFGSPKAVTKALLSENRSGKPYLYLKPFLWGVLFVLFLRESLYQDRLAPLFLCLACLALFELIHGREHMAIARRFNAGHFSAGRVLLSHALIFAVIAGKETIMWYACTHTAALPAKLFHLDIGELIGALFSLFELLLLLITGIMLAKSAFASIRYYPATLHAMGAAVSAARTSQLLCSVDLTSEISREILFYPILCYAASLILALCFAALLRTAKAADLYPKRGACHGCTD